MAGFNRETQLKRANLVIEAIRNCWSRRDLREGATPFVIWRTDTNQVLARNIIGYEAAKDKANELRRRYNLKWDQVKFKPSRTTTNKTSGGYRYDTAKSYNSSKRTYFKGRYDRYGNYADLD